MNRAVLVLALLAGLLVVPGSAGAQPAAAVPAPRVSSSVDRTAMWIADRVAFTIEIACAPGVDILADDVAKEKLRLNGLDVVSSDTSVTTDADGRTTHRIRYVLTTYKADTPSPSIEAMSVRYYARRPGERLQDVAPAGDVKVPGAVLAFRSTLPETQTDLAIRDGRPPSPRGWFFARASQFGLALVLVSLAPALVVAATTLRRRTAGKPARRSARQTKQEQRAMLDRLRGMEVASDEDRRRACDEISTAVRSYVASHAHVPAQALTPTEIDTALSARGGRIPRETVVDLLARCDAARYGGTVMTAEACRDAIGAAEQILTGH